MKILQMLAALVNSMLPPPPQRVLTSGNFAGVASVVNTAIPKTKTRKNINQPEKPRRSGILTASWPRFLAATLFALLFIAQPSNAQNVAPVGLPAISGTATQGETLTADTSSITDADGFSTHPNFFYQWKADGADISGGLAATFILTQSQVGKAITVTVSYTDRGRNDESLTSAETSAVVNANDAPTITGIPLGIVAEDSAYSFTPTGADVDAGTTLTYSIENKPSWATFDAATGALTGTPGNDDVFFTMGIVISVTDGMETASLQPFNLVVTPVNDAPTITGMPATTVVQDQPYSFTPSGGDVDDGATLVYSIANKPSWAMFSTTTGALTGTPTNVGSTSDIVITLTSGSDTVSLPAFNLAVTIEADNTAPDNTAPDAPVITQPTTPTNDDSITINGSAEAGATVTLTQNDTVLTSPTATAGANGDWSIEVTLSANNNGANTFTATASDSADNTSAASAAVSITLDTVAPTVTFTNPTQLVRTAAFTLTGTVTAGATVDVFKDGTSIGAVNVTATTWSVATRLIEGLNAFTATATDADDNTSTANTVITLNTLLAEAPVITVINTVLNNANEQGVICITFDGDVKFDGSPNAAFLNARPGDFVVSSDTSPAPTVIGFVGACFVDSVTHNNTIQLTLNRQIAFGETATLSYTKTGTEHNTKGIRRDLTGSSEPLADFSNKPITNNAIEPIEGLELRSAQTFSKPNQILLTFGESIIISPGGAADFTVSGAASSPTVTTIGGLGTPANGPPGSSVALLLTLSANIVGGEIITLSYTKTMGSITGATEGGLEDFTDYSVTNNRPLAAPSISISPNTVTAIAGTAITPISITSTGGAVASYGIAPDIGNGLMFGASTGIISGTPTAAAEAISYIITATNSGGTATATVAITVNADPAPVITPPARERLPKPVITTTSPTLPVSTAMFTVAGTAEPGVKITILQDDPECDNSNSPTGTGTVVSDAEGNWTIDITLCEGVNNIQAVASIPGENPDKDPSALSEAIVITLDIPVPARERLPKPVITTSPTLPVSTAMFTVAGTAEPGVKITILQDDPECDNSNSPTGTGTVVSDAVSGDWTIDITLCDGVNNIQAVASIPGENPDKDPSALSEAIVITLDIPVPARERLPKPVITTSPTLPVSTAMFTVAGTAEPGVKITILQDDPECDNSNSPTGTGTVVSDAEGDWTIDITLCEGVNNIQAVASIPGENPDKDPSALPNMIVITLDTTDPAPVITPPVQSAVPAITTASAATVSTAMFTVTGTAEPGVKITILRDGSGCANTPRLSGSGVSDAEGDWTIDITLCDGVNNIQAVATMAGKAPSALSEAIVITLDTTDPAPVITPPVPPTPPTAPTASAAPPILVDPLQLSAARLTVVLGETKEVTISGGLPPYVAPFVSGDLDVVRTSIDGTTLSITGLRVGKADTAQVRLRPRGSASGFGYLQVKVNAPPVLNPEDNDGSVFRGGASSDGGETYFKDNAFSAGESLNIVFVITPRRADIGEQANIVVMAKEASAPDTVVLATESGLVSYDGETLFFFKEDITLERNTFINLTPEPIILWPAEVGNYELFIGYQIADGEVLYHAEPLKIEVVL